MRSFKSLSIAAALSASDKKGEDILLLHVRKTSPLADYLLIVTATSKPHLDALENAIEETAERAGVQALRRSKPVSHHWRVLDFGGLIVHLMTAEARAFYALEKLHHGAPKVPWEERELVK